MKHLKIFAILAVFLFSFSGCITMNKTERAKANQIKRTFSAEFKRVAQETYGKKAKLTDISVVSDIGGVMFEFSASATDTLEAKVKLGDSSFVARYNSKTGELISNRNYDKIAASARSFFEDMGFELVDFEFDKYPVSPHFYPDYVDTFEEFIKANGIAELRVYTTNDLSKLTADDFDDFAALYDGYVKKSQYSTDGVTVLFYSLSDVSLIDKIKENGLLDKISNDDYSQKAMKECKVNYYLYLVYAPSRKQCFIRSIHF